MSNKLIRLAENIIKDGKMSADTIMKHFAESLCECECGEMEKEYKYLYEDAYGHKLSKDIAEDWVRSMAVPDGSVGENGQKWSMDSTTEHGNKLNIDWSRHNKIDFYVVMNMMYSDYYKTAKALGMQEDSMFFARLAKDWLCDEDAHENKLYRYYFEVVV